MRSLLFITIKPTGSVERSFLGLTLNLQLH
jgi:hypothetical protein